MDIHSSDSKTIRQKLHVPTIHAVRVVVVDPVQAQAKKVSQILQTQRKNIFSPVSLLSPKSNALEEVSVDQGNDCASTGSDSAISDKQLDSMELILNRKLQGVSIQQWYDSCWSEVGMAAGFYERWLMESGKLNVRVGAWEACSDVFCGDVFSQKRIVSFCFDRTTHLYTGPPRADVRQTHYCRIEEGKNRCIVSIKIEMQGIPFADAFHVQLRWVATKLSESVISIKIGLFVVFTKKILVAGKIRAATTTETRKSQQSLFQKMKQTFGQVYEEEEEEAIEMNPCMIFLQDVFIKRPATIWTFCSPESRSRNIDDLDDIDRELIEIHHKLKLIKMLPVESHSEMHVEEYNYMKVELQTAIHALDEIIRRSPSSRPKEKAETQQSFVNHIAGTVLSPVIFSLKYFHSIGNKVNVSIFGDQNRPESQGTIRSRRVTFRLKPSNSDQRLLRASPDAFLPSMTIILDRTFKNTSVKSIYNRFFSQRSKAFYQSWLEGAEGGEVSISDWMSSADENELVSEWSKESFDQNRTLEYKFQRHALIQLGPREAHVVCTQWCRLEDNLLVLESSYHAKGIPFEDAFTVQLRSVFCNELPLDGAVTVQVGLFVVFTKKCLLEGKIRSGAIQEATRQQSSLFREIRNELSLLNPAEGIHDNQEDNATLDSSRHSDQHDELAPRTEDGLANKVQLIEQKLSSVESAIEKRSERAVQFSENFLVEQLNIAHQALESLSSFLARENVGVAC